MMERRGRARAGLDEATGPAATAHELCNVVGALQLRFTVVHSNPTCRWAQAENLAAMADLLATAMKLARKIETDASLPGAGLPRRASPRTVTPKGR